MEKSAFFAGQTCAQELDPLREYRHDAVQAPEFEDPSKPCVDVLSKLAGVLRASIVECCALRGNVGGG